MKTEQKVRAAVRTMMTTIEQCAQLARLSILDGDTETAVRLITAIERAGALIVRELE